jgi:hypothetical protein
LDCHAVDYAKEGEPRMSDGTCVSIGFGVAGNSSTETSPWTGDIVITTYTAATLHDDFDALSTTVVV